MGKISFVFLAVFFLFVNSEMLGQTYRTISGEGNNIDNPTMGAALTRQVRWVPADFGDGISSPNAEERTNARIISNYIFDQKESIPNELKLSDYLWVFGQFVDHDMTLVLNADHEYIGVPIPKGDEYFDEDSKMYISRTRAMEGTGTAESNPRDYVNEITSFIDGSAVYGSDTKRASWLRTFKDGKLKTSESNMLPWNTTTGYFNDPKSIKAPMMADDVMSGTKLFVAGDIRANENPLLISMQTIFLREHNRICDEYKAKYPILTDEELYQRARKWVGAYIQSIVYNEWLPSMGVPITPYTGYKSSVDPRVSTEFSTTAFRFGHTLINSNMIRMNNEGEELAQGSMSLAHGYFNPTAIILSQGIETFLIGMGTQEHQEADCRMVDDLRNFLFGAPGAGGIDLATVNITRAREKGLPDFNTMRSQLGLPRIPSFLDLTRNEKEANRLEFIYGNMDNIDPWVGMLAEHHMPGSLFGNTIVTIVRRQFEVTRDGDRYFYENDGFFTNDDLEILNTTKLYDIILRNSSIERMQEDLFFAMPHSSIPRGPDIFPFDLEMAVYPNPTRGHIALKIYAELEKTVHLYLYDINAKLIVSQVYEMTQGDNFLESDILVNAPRGVYNLVVQTEDAFNISRIIKEY